MKGGRRETLRASGSSVSSVGRTPVNPVPRVGGVFSTPPR